MDDCHDYVQAILAPLFAWLADLEEQWLIAGLAKNQCPRCVAGTHELGENVPGPVRTFTSILAAIRAVRESRPDATTWQFANTASNVGLGGVEEPFWHDMEGVDICGILSADLLHFIRKRLKDHDMKWTTNTLGDEEVDARIRSDSHRLGEQSFPKGIARILQWTGRQTRDLEQKWVTQLQEHH